jgi:hypothetical protein
MERSITQELLREAILRGACPHKLLPDIGTEVLSLSQSKLQWIAIHMPDRAREISGAVDISLMASSGYGYGYGHGSGYGHGYGFGYSSGDGSGHGECSGSGYGYGYRWGDGYGDGNGSGYGYGGVDDEGYGYSDGDGYGDGWSSNFQTGETRWPSHVRPIHRIAGRGLRLAQ